MCFPPQVANLLGKISNTPRQAQPQVPAPEEVLLLREIRDALRKE